MRGLLCHVLGLVGYSARGNPIPTSFHPTATSEQVGCPNCREWLREEEGCEQGRNLLALHQGCGSPREKGVYLLSPLPNSYPIIAIPKAGRTSLSPPPQSSKNQFL